MGLREAGVALMVFAAGCSDSREDTSTAKSSSGALKDHKDDDGSKHASNAPDGGTTGSVPSTGRTIANQCALPVAAFLADWRAPSNANSDRGLRLGKVSDRLFGLLDQLDVGATPAAFPALQALPRAEQRMTVVAAAIQVTHKWPSHGDDEREDEDESEDDEEGKNGFRVNCVELKRLAHGAPKSILQIAEAVNLAAGSPVSAQQLAAYPFKQHFLPWEIAAANDEGEGLHGQQTQARTVVANPVKQLFEGFAGATSGKDRTSAGPRKLWLPAVNSQAGLDALLRALGDSTPPPPPTLAPVAVARRAG